jgi:hypothetical protein
VPVLQLLRDRQVPNLLSDPGGVGSARRSDDVDSPRGDLDEEQDVSVFRNTDSIVKTSQAATPLPVLAETRSRSDRCDAVPVPGQPDAGRAGRCLLRPGCPACGARPGG